MDPSEFFADTTKKLSGGEYLALLMETLEIPYLFTLPGSQDLPILDATPNYAPNMRIVATRNERVSVHIAEGYGKASGRIAVTLPTLGPGIANELPGLYSAFLSHAPLLSLTPAQPPNKLSRISEVFQGLDPQPLLKPITKRCLRCETASDLGAMFIELAFLALADPKGPVHLEIPFPLLFTRSRYPLPNQEGIRKSLHNKVGTPTQGKPRGFLVTDSPHPESTAPFPQRVTSGFQLLSPGIPEATAPFALGVALAYPDLPVLIPVTQELLKRSLDTLWIAEELGISLFLGYKETSDEKRGGDLFPWIPSRKPLPILSEDASLPPGLFFIVL